MPFSKSKTKTVAEDVRRVALSALVTALEERNQEPKSKPARTGLRTVATGAVLYTAGRALYSGRHAILDRLGDGQGDEEDREDDEYDEAEAESDADEPEAEADEDNEPESRVRPIDRPPEPPDSDTDDESADAEAQPVGR